VSNAVDECPETPQGDVVDSAGCTVPPPTSPPPTSPPPTSTAPTSAAPTGTPASLPPVQLIPGIQDSDGDGVDDASDLCPGTLIVLENGVILVDDVGCSGTSSCDSFRFVRSRVLHGNIAFLTSLKVF